MFEKAAKIRNLGNCFKFKRATQFWLFSDFLLEFMFLLLHRGFYKTNIYCRSQDIYRWYGYKLDGC